MKVVHILQRGYWCIPETSQISEKCVRREKSSSTGVIIWFEKDKNIELLSLDMLCEEAISNFAT